MLEMKMANKRVKGDTIAQYNPIKSKSTELYKVKIIYQDESGKTLSFVDYYRGLPKVFR